MWEFFLALKPIKRELRLRNIVCNMAYFQKLESACYRKKLNSIYPSMFPAKEIVRFPPIHPLDIQYSNDKLVLFAADLQYNGFLTKKGRELLLPYLRSRI